MGTDAAPADGQYHVLLNGAIVLSTPSKSKAAAVYRQLREKLGAGEPQEKRPDSTELLRRLKAEADINSMMAASAAAKRAHATYKRGTPARWKSP
jgi:hypothetical protein